MDDKLARKWAKLDIAYMSAICAPRASLEVLKLMNDWNGWVFAFDDRKFVLETQCGTMPQESSHMGTASPVPHDSSRASFSLASMMTWL